jgi:hypothetical protein
MLVVSISSPYQPHQPHHHRTIQGSLGIPGTLSAAPVDAHTLSVTEGLEHANGASLMMWFGANDIHAENSELYRAQVSSSQTHTRAENYYSTATSSSPTPTDTPPNTRNVPPPTLCATQHLIPSVPQPQLLQLLLSLFFSLSRSLAWPQLWSAASTTTPPWPPPALSSTHRASSQTGEGAGVGAGRGAALALSV